jgi:hypothetical protein
MSSGSQKRRVTKPIKVNCTPEYHAKLRKLADGYGQSLSALCLNALLGIPLPRERRPRVDTKALSQYLAANARASDAVRTSAAEFGKVNSNVNQIAHILNAGRPPERVMGIIETTLLEHREAKERHDEALRDLFELRTLGMKALGLEPDRDF